MGTLPRSMLAQASHAQGMTFWGRWLACKEKYISNVDDYEVIELGAIDQNKKSILNEKNMQHLAKGKDLRTSPKSYSPSLENATKEKILK